MAQIKRKKISGELSKGQAKEKKGGKKKFVFIASFFALVAVVVAVILIVYFATNKEENKVEDYFGSYTSSLIEKVYDEENSQKYKDVEFTKMTYEGLKMYTNEAYKNASNTYTFYLALDLTSFYPDEAIDDGKEKSDDADDPDADVFLYNKDHKKIFKDLVEFQYAVNEYNNSDNGDKKIVNFFIIDSSKYSLITTDTSYGGSEEEPANTIFAVYSGDKQSVLGLNGDKVKFKGQSVRGHVLKTNSLSDLHQIIVDGAKVLMNNNFELIED